MNSIRPATAQVSSFFDIIQEHGANAPLLPDTVRKMVDDRVNPLTVQIRDDSNPGIPLASRPYLTSLEYLQLLGDTGAEPMNLVRNAQRMLIRTATSSQLQHAYFATLWNGQETSRRILADSGFINPTEWNSITFWRTLKSNPGQYAQEPNMYGPIYEATRGNSAEALNLLHEHFPQYFTDYHVRYAFGLGASVDCPQALEWFYQHCKDLVDIMPFTRQMTLDQAASNGFIGVVECIQRNSPDDFGLFTLQTASSKGRTKVLDLLHTHYPEFFDRPLVQTAIRGNRWHGTHLSAHPDAVRWFREHFPQWCN